MKWQHSMVLKKPGLPKDVIFDQWRWATSIPITRRISSEMGFLRWWTTCIAPATCMAHGNTSGPRLAIRYVGQGIQSNKLSLRHAGARLSRNGNQSYMTLTNLILTVALYIVPNSGSRCRSSCSELYYERCRHKPIIGISSVGSV